MTSVKRASESLTAENIARADEIKAGIRTVSEDLKGFRADMRSIASTVMSAKNIGT